jgi:hypothetical protein
MPFPMIPAGFGFCHAPDELTFPQKGFIQGRTQW